MNPLLWAGLLCYGLAFAIVLGFAVAYLTRRQFMPYHRIATGQPWDSLAPGMQALVLALMRAAGAAWLAAVVAAAMLAYPLLISRPSAASVALFQAYCVLALGPPLAIARSVRRATGAPTPTRSAAAMLALSLLGGALCALSTLPGA